MTDGRDTDARQGLPIAEAENLDDRLRWAARFRKRVAAHSEMLCRVTEREIGKPAFETMTSDLMPLLASCRWHERRARRLLRRRAVRGRALWQVGQRHDIGRAPVGRVGIIATWNYPIQLLGIQLVQALVAGNRVVVKPSERCPETHRALLELALESGVTRQGLTVLDATRDAGRALIADHDVDLVVFTGSTGVGRAVAASLAERLIPSALELSGRDSAIVLDDADPRLAARSIWAAATFNAGQTCMAPRRALVHERVYAEFVRALRPLASGAKPRRLIDEDSAALVHGIAARSIDAGARSLSGIIEPPGPGDCRSLRPIALADTPEHAPAVDGDHFGPLLAVVPVSSLDDALRIHGRCDAHLATSVYTRSARVARDVAPLLGAGLVTINDTLLPTAHPGAPIAGRAASGWGATQGAEGLLAMTRPVTVSRTAGFARPPVGEPTAATLRGIAWAVRWLYAGGSPARTGHAAPPPSADQPATNQRAAAGSARPHHAPPPPTAEDART